MDDQEMEFSVTIQFTKRADGSLQFKEGQDLEKAKTILSELLNQNSLELQREDVSISYREAIEAKHDLIWKNLAFVTLGEAIGEWLSTIKNPCTKKTYETAMNELIKHRFIHQSWSLQLFSLLSSSAIIDKIKTNAARHWSIRTRETRISCLLSFTRYLSRKTEGIVRRGVPSKEGIEKTFSPKPRKVKTEALTRSQLIRFFEELDKINQRDATIARLCLHGAKRISEVIHLRTDQINYEKQQIQFKQSKSKLADDFTIISFERSAAKALFDHLKNYIEDRQGLVFTTSQGRLIQKTQVDRNFAKAGERAGIPFRVSPHNLRATAVTLWKEDGFPDSLIMKATGHASAEMVNRYDKTDIADNVTKKSCLL